MRKVSGYLLPVLLVSILGVASRAKAATPAEIWRREVAASATPVSIALSKDGDIVVSGNASSDTNLFNRKFDIVTAKLRASDGQVIWSQRYDDPESLSDRATNVALDSAGNVIVTGSAETAKFGYVAKDMRTVKYSATNGALVWERFYDGRDHLDEFGNFVLVDGRDDVMVVGTSTSLEQRQDLYTVKYSGADGSLLWEARLAGPNDDTPILAALDPQGNAFVASTSSMGSSSSTTYLTKFAANDGAVIWQQTLRGVSSLLVDANGDLFLSGTSLSNVLSKYSGKDGAVLWERNEVPPTDKDGSGGRLYLGPDGNVIVIGGLWVPSPLFAQNALTLAKFSPDGSRLWRNTYRPAQQSFAGVGSLAIDENDDLLVRGLSTTNGARFTSFLGKFSGLDGSALWQVETPELDGGTVASLPGGKFALATNTVEANGETPVSTRLLVLVFRDDPAPHLAVFAQSGSVRIAWLQSAAGWNLEQRTGLDPNSEWLKVVVPQGAASYEAPLAGTDGPMLFRLSRPE